MEKTPPAAGGGGDKSKRDEWSEGAVSRLLEAYEAKWVLRNRAKLKGHDWEEVARFVSTTADAPKTQTQCKNKIESMKKRYRSESAAAPSSSKWPLYQRIHHLLTGGLHLHKPPPPPLEASPFAFQFPTPTNGVVFIKAKQEEEEEDGGGKLSHSDRPQHEHENILPDGNSTNSTTPGENAKIIRPSSSNKTSQNKKMRKEKSDMVLIAESVRWVAEAVVRMEKERMEAMRELETMRAEAEIRRGELELKRTRIVADTQLEIARLLSGKGAQSNTMAFGPETSLNET